MDAIDELLDSAKKACSMTSDAQLARKLGVTPQSLSAWRKGKAAPDIMPCAKIAEITGIPLARVLGIVGEARAISREEKAVWRRLATAAVMLLSLSPFAGRATDFHHTVNVNTDRVYALCEIDCGRRDGACSSLQPGSVNLPDSEELPSFLPTIAPLSPNNCPVFVEPPTKCPHRLISTDNTPSIRWLSAGEAS